VRYNVILGVSEVRYNVILGEKPPHNIPNSLLKIIVGVTMILNKG
jgi:hypothetical protein